MNRKSYTGINIQWPISQDILTGKKTVETRTYPLPSQYLNQEMLLIETPGPKGKFKARMVAIIKFTQCFEYKNEKAFYADYSRHLVDKNSPWAWKDKNKWGWIVELLRKLKMQRPCPRKGIVYTRNLNL